jgi:predicted glycosyltransferase involved in capsule biosynthesis
MTREQSRRVLRWNPADPVPGKLYRNQRTRACPGGLWIVHADLFNAHRMDERFEGWGCEDTEFLRRIPWRRLPGPLFHIWHAKASKEALGRNRRLLRNALMKG